MQVARPEYEARKVVRPSARGRASHVVLATTVALVALMAGRSLLPLWLPLLLAAWFANLARPLSHRLERRLRGKTSAAAVISVLLVIVVLSPVAIILLTLTRDAVHLARRVLGSPTAESALRSIVTGGDAEQSLQSLLTTNPQRAFNLLRDGAGGAFGFASNVAGTTIAIVVGLVVFVSGFYVFLLHGASARRWLQRNLPLTGRQFRAFSSAFYETGRGLIVGIGVTALAQGVIAGVGYVIVGVPHAFVLALLTAAAALIPSLGSGLVWLPVSAALALAGNVSDGIVVFAIGGLAGILDNFIRPALSRVGRLRVPMFVLFCSMLGGMMAFGASGLIVGPLFVRLTMEGLRLWRRRNPPLVVPPS